MGNLLRDGMPLTEHEKRMFQTPRELREIAEAERRKAITAPVETAKCHTRRAAALVDAALTLERSKVLL